MLASFIATMLLLGSQLPTATAATGEPAAQLQQILASGHHPDLRWPDLSDVQPDLVRLYENRGWAPLWFSGESLTPPGRAMLEVLDQAQNWGLDPADYDASWLRAIAGHPDSLLRARVDLGLSVAAARFAMALRRGRVSPAAVHATLRLPLDSFPLDSAVAGLARTDRPNDLLRSYEPTLLHYWLLMAALVRYRELARDSGLTALPQMPRLLRPGQRYAGVPALRRLLRALGDLRDSLDVSTMDTLYSDELVGAVKRFQARQGFAPDGVIGDSTRGRLLEPLELRIRQMELTLERWRWMPRRYPAPPIIVNIPAFRLAAFSGMQSDESSLLRMNVVVGKAFRSETPVFAANMTYLVFAPYWDVPPTIAVKEIKPDARRDPGFLTRNRYELVQGSEVLPPWPENIARIGAGVRVRQTPGPWNALGGVKFVLPNEYQIYLHDTPSREWFERTRRDASHGCIRVSDALALARFLLRDRPEWTDEAIREAMAAEEPLRVDLSHPVPVFILYTTALARQNGEVYFYSDLYGHDRTLDSLLRQGYPYPR